MKKNLIIFILCVLAVGAYLGYETLGASSMKITNTIEGDTFSIEMPKAFEIDAEGAYFNEKTDMLIQWRYYPKEMGINAEMLLHILTTNEFEEGDVYSIYEVEIDNEDAYQAEYRALATGNDGIHYYYSGVMTAVELEDEFLILDAYQYMTESEGINREISEDDLQLLKDITSTVKITDADYGNTEISSQSFYGDNLSIQLSNNWEAATEDENGMYDYGYYASYRFMELPFWVDINEYNDDNINDLEYAKETMMSMSNYDFQGNAVIGEEEGFVFSYHAYSSDGEAPYVYGVFGVSEHYILEIYFYSYDSELEANQDFVDAAFDLINK